MQSLTVRDVVREYCSHLNARVSLGELSSRCAEETQRNLEAFVVSHGDRLVSECRRRDLAAWLVANPQWLSNHTRKRAIASIQSCFNWAEDELVPANPFRRHKLKLTLRPRRPAAIAEYVLLMRRGGRALRRALFFLRRTGARTCEMRRVLISEVLWDYGCIRMVDHKTEKASNGEPRLIGLDSATLRFLANIVRNRKQLPNRECDCEIAHKRKHFVNDHVFLGSYGNAWCRHSFARNLRRLADRIGLPKDLSPYSIRHLVATEAVESGLGDRQIADVLGHSTTHLVGWYSRQSRIRMNHLRRVAEQIARRKRG